MVFPFLLDSDIQFLHGLLFHRNRGLANGLLVLTRSNLWDSLGLRFRRKMAHKSTLQLNLVANVLASRQRRSNKLPLLHPTHRKCSLPDNNKCRSRKKPNRPWKYLDSRPTTTKTIEVFLGCRILQRDRISKEIDEKFQLEPNDVRNILYAVLPSCLGLHNLSDCSNQPKTNSRK